MIFRREKQKINRRPQSPSHQQKLQHDTRKHVSALKYWNGRAWLVIHSFYIFCLASPVLMFYYIRSIQPPRGTVYLENQQDERCTSYEDIVSPSKKERLHCLRGATAAEETKHSHNSPIKPVPLEWLIVHQTVSLPLEEPSKTWHESWSEQGFTTTLQGDDENRNDMVRLSEKLNTRKHLDTYDDLPATIQRVDMWRYAKLFLDGGIYADIDISATPCTLHLLQTYFARTIGSDDLLVLKETLDLGSERLIHSLLRMRPFGVFHTMGLDTTIRYPQYRQSIMIAGPPGRRVFLDTLDMIVERFQTQWYEQFSHKAWQTLELTGPGVFTDAMNHNLAQGSSSTVVSRKEGDKLFVHFRTGTWK
jgi:hypothetical protein